MKILFQCTNIDNPADREILHQTIFRKTIALTVTAAENVGVCAPFLLSVRVSIFTQFRLPIIFI